MTVEMRKCLCCGNRFEAQRKETRKYCSRQCGSKATYRRQYQDNANKLWAHEKSVFDAAMELYWSGEESSVISRRLNIPVGTIYSWVHDFGEEKQRIEPLKDRLSLARSANEWLVALRENTLWEKDVEETFCLVCGKLHGQSVYKLTTVVFERLKENPLNGKVYAFCNKGGNTITTLAWREPIFHISKYIKVSGTFIWSQEKLGTAIDVTKTEFEHLISLQKHKRIAENTGFYVDVVV